jgi:hypothetical protein
MAYEDNTSFVLFGGPSTELYRFISSYLSIGNPGALTRDFIDRAVRALAQETDALPRGRRPAIGTFRTLGQLNTFHNAQTEKHPGFDNALLCIAQIIDYIE